MRYKVIRIITQILLTVTFFVLGSLAVFLGLSKGTDMASSLSRPTIGYSWTVPNGMVLGCTYTPVIIGISLIILSIILSTILFYKWVSKNN